MNSDLYFRTKQLWVNVRVNKSLARGKNRGSTGGKGNILLVLYIIILMK